MYAIETKEDFKLELNSLLTSLDDSIDAIRTYVGTTKGLPSTSATNKINQLKIQEYKIKEISLSLLDMCEEDWEGHKDSMQKEFLLTRNLLNELSSKKT